MLRFRRVVRVAARGAADPTSRLVHRLVLVFSQQTGTFPLYCMRCLAASVYVGSCSFRRAELRRVVMIVVEKRALSDMLCSELGRDRPRSRYLCRFRSSLVDTCRAVGPLWLYPSHARGSGSATSIFLYLDYTGTRERRVAKAKSAVVHARVPSKLSYRRLRWGSSPSPSLADPPLPPSLQVSRRPGQLKVPTVSPRRVSSHPGHQRAELRPRHTYRDFSWEHVQRVLRPTQCRVHYTRKHPPRRVSWIMC